jgi:hypothetical protein
MTNQGPSAFFEEPRSKAGGHYFVHPLSSNICGINEDIPQKVISTENE